MVFEAYDKNPLLSSRYTKKGFEVKRGINYTHVDKKRKFVECGILVILEIRIISIYTWVVQ